MNYPQSMMALVKYGVATMIFGATLFSGTAQANDYERCSRIQDVTVPFEVENKDDTLIFTGHTTIKISQFEMQKGSEVFENQALAADLHSDLTIFLKAAAKVAVKSSELGLDIGENSMFIVPDAFETISMDYMETLADMCDAIFELDSTQHKIQSEFSNFTTPVKINLI